MHNHLQQAFRDAAFVLTQVASDEAILSKTVQAAELIASSIQDNKKVLICGNGGSACDAMHFAEEFTGRYRKNRRALPVLSLTDPAHITCVANDFGFEEVFSRGVEAFGQKGDIFIGLSTSGNSENVIRAVQKAKDKGVHTISLLGKDGGKLSSVCDIEFVAPGLTADRIQEAHMTILHIIIEGVERLLFPEQYL